MTVNLNTIPHPPQTQALSSTTFRPPPLDGSLTPAELFDWHLKNTPNHALFVFARKDGTIRTIQWPEAVQAMHVGARLVRTLMNWQPGMKDVPVVGILAASDNISYFTTISAIIRAGYAAFPISPRNSPAAVAHLLKNVNVQHLLVGHEPSLEELANEALKTFQEGDSPKSKPTISPIPLFEDLYNQTKVNPADLPLDKQDLSAIVLYLHSSGSTSFPKPIPCTNRRFLEFSLCYYFGERDMTGQIFSLHTIPMFHALGIMQMACVVATGIIVSTFEPESPTHIPTPQTHFEAAVATQSDMIFTVPAVIESWSQNNSYVDWLATRSGVLFGGGALNASVGNYLTSQGVSIFNLYGSTEGGAMSRLLPLRSEEDWDYFKFSGNITPDFIPQGDGTFELVLVSQPFCNLLVVNTQVNGVDAFNTSDLMVEHPSKPGYWRVFGRSDDQIIHSTGEKTNPGPLENILNCDSHVRSAVMFGRGQFQAGVIIDPVNEFALDPSDLEKLADFRNKIWSTVHKLNEFAPQHSRIFKEMILVSKPTKPFSYTAKNTARRQAVINHYQSEIDDLYQSVASTMQSNIPLPLEWTEKSTLTFVRSVVSTVLERTLLDEDDIFQHGCDSLQATWIRNSLLRALRDGAKVDTRDMFDNFVYQHPTIARLATFFNALIGGQTSFTATVPIEDKIRAMDAMVEKYSKNFYRPKFCRQSKHICSSTRAVLVTGTTGGLGSNLLAQLIADPTISRVYALNRPRRSPIKSLEAAQRRSLEERNLDPSSIFDSGKLRLVEADTTLPNLGVSDGVLEEIRQSVTTIIHTAWPVDFKLSLPSFEPNISGLRNLIDLALSSKLERPPVVAFTSTFGVFQSVSDKDEYQKENLIPASTAVGSGYSESKWVAEQILANASRGAMLSTMVVRVGQLSGDRSGSWNISEWFPSLVQSSAVIGCFPTTPKVVSWLPLHLAARALADFSKAEIKGLNVAHLIHPRPVSWESLATVFSAQLALPLVSFSDWFLRLEKFASDAKGRSPDGNLDDQTLRHVSALRLLPFFRDVMSAKDEGGDGMGLPYLDCSTALLLSSTLAEDIVSQLSASDVVSWLEYWRRVGFLVSKPTANHVLN